MREALSPGQLDEAPQRIEAAGVRRPRGPRQSRARTASAVARSRRRAGLEVVVVAEVGAHEDQRALFAEKLADEVRRRLRGDLRHRDRQEREAPPEHPLQERQLDLERVLGGVWPVVHDRAARDGPRPGARRRSAPLRAASPTRRPRGRPRRAPGRGARGRTRRHARSRPRAGGGARTRSPRRAPSRSCPRAGRRGRAGAGAPGGGGSAAARNASTVPRQLGLRGRDRTCPRRRAAGRGASS